MLDREGNDSIWYTKRELVELLKLSPAQIDRLEADPSLAHAMFVPPDPVP